MPDDARPTEQAAAPSARLAYRSSPIESRSRLGLLSVPLPSARGSSDPRYPAYRSSCASSQTRGVPRDRVASHEDTSGGSEEAGDRSMSRSQSPDLLPCPSP